MQCEQEEADIGFAFGVTPSLGYRREFAAPYRGPAVLAEVMQMNTQFGGGAQLRST